MSECNAWVAFYWSDYIGKTRDLRPVEHGIYCQLLAEYYIQGAPLPADRKRLERICGARTGSEREALDVIIQRFFILDGDVFRQKRADKEIAKRLEISGKRRDAANTRYANAPANAVHMHTQPQPQLQNHVGARQKQRTQLPGDFVPNDTNRRIAKELGIDLDEALAAFKDFHGSKGSVMKDWNLALNTWLRNERRWGPKKPTQSQVTTGSLSENYRQLREKYQ